MLRTFDIKIPIILLLNVCYIFIISSINTEISPYVYILLPAVFIVPPAFYLGFASMVFVVLVSAYLCEVYMPIRTGIIPLIWFIVSFFIHKWRYRYRTLDAFSIISLMLLVNFFLLLVYAAILPNSCKSFSACFYRVAIDVSVSSMILIFIAKLTVDLPVSIMKIFGADISIAEGD